MSIVKRERWDQAGKRRTVLFSDQHGRQWAGTKDIHTDTTIGEPMPSGWTPVKFRGRALVPPAGCLLFDDSKPGQFTIDYDRWRGELLIAHQRWTQMASQYAASMYGEKQHDALKNPPPELLNILGPKPMPLEVLDAMLEGNRWVLGLSDKRPSWATAIFGEPEPETKERRFLDVEEEEENEGSDRPRDEGGRFVRQEA